MVEIVSKKKNIYSEKMIDDYGEYYIGITNNTKAKFYVDAEDYDKIKDYCWYENVRKGTNMLLAHVEDKTISMHRFLGFKWCDHIDRNELNNRRCNLRECTQQENRRNHSLRSNNTTGFTGVFWSKRDCIWRAYVKINGKQIHLGCFVNKDDAIKARLKGELKYFGAEFSPQRDLFEQYGITTQNDCEVVE